MANKRLKPILPSLKENKRYLVFEIMSKGKSMDFKIITNTILKQALNTIGEIESAKAGIWLFPTLWNPKTMKGIIRIGHKHVDHMKTSLALIKSIEGNETLIRTVSVSGTIKQAKKLTIAS